MRRYERELEALGVKVAVVTFDSIGMAKGYVESTQLQWPLLLDSERELYRSYGLERAGWWSIYGPSSIWHYLKLMANGQKLKRPGKDFRQLGGDVLIDPSGTVRYYYASESPHDRPEPDEILKVVRVTNE